jgi:hypothetical protein
MCLEISDFKLHDLVPPKGGYIDKWDTNNKIDPVGEFMCPRLK